MFESTDLNALLQEVLSLVAPTLDKQSIVCEVSFHQDLPSLEVDHDALQQVFLNLINNSVDAMMGGGRLEVATVLNRQASCADVIISDTGPGMDRDTLDHLFEPMWTTKNTGSGFGLAIAHQIIVEHGGQIEVVPGLRQGAAFRISLPLPQFDSPRITNREVMTNVA